MEQQNTLSVAATDPAESTNDSEADTTRTRSRSPLNQTQGMRVTFVSQMLTTIENNPEISALLAPFGYNEITLAQGAALQETARNSFTARQQALASQKQARIAFYTLHGQARRAYANFRMLARATLDTEQADSALLLNMQPPRDVSKFITMAHATYRTVLETPAFLTAMEPVGYTAADIEELDTQITALEQAETAHRNALSHIHATKLRRDEAVMKMDAWMTRFRAIARIALRDRPELAKMLDVGGISRSGPLPEPESER